MNRYFLFPLLLLALKAEAQTSALSIADSLHAVGNYSEAIKVLEQTAPKDEAVYVKLAKAHQAGREFTEAKKYYQKVLNSNPGRVVTAVDYARLLSRTGELDSADSIFSALAETYPETANFQYQLGLVREKKRDSTATALFYKTIALDSTHQLALYKISKKALARRRFFTAEKFSLLGLKSNPTNVSLISILAQSFFHRKKYELALPQLEQLVEFGEGSEFVHRMLGSSHFRLGDYEKAIEQYQKALEFEDRNPKTHLSLGQLFFRTGDYNKSEIHLLMAILLKKQLLDSEYLSLALTYKETKDFPKAMKYLQRAIEENPKNERALFERAIVADHYFKDNQAKIKYYQAYLERFKTIGSENLVRLAQQRLNDLKAELHFDG